MTKAKLSEFEQTEHQQRRTLIAVALIVLAAAAGGFVILKLLPDKLLNDPYVVIVLLVAAFVSVTLLLYLGTIIMRTAGLGAPGEALGMPEGSIRALIAMSLVLIFAIIGVTVLYSGLGGEIKESNGITAAQLERLENVQIVAISVVDPSASPGTERFNVTARAELSPAGHDFGLQLLSTVSTLVVAVAGFYFGSRSVAQAAKTSNEAAATALAASRQLAATVAADVQAATAPAVAAGTVGTDEPPLTDDDIIGTIEDDEGVADGDDVTHDVLDADAETEASDAAAEAEAIAAETQASESATEPEDNPEPGGGTETGGGPKPTP